ncbi:hypothetical protein CsSME_00045793 [Camellia sinensis var. sinensis]
MASSPPYNPPSSGTCNEIVPVGDTNHTSSSSNTTQINEPTTTTNNRSDSEAEALPKLIKADLNSIALGAARGISYLHSLGPTSPAPSNSSRSSSGSPPTPHPSSSQPSGITVVGTVLTALDHADRVRVIDGGDVPVVSASLDPYSINILVHISITSPFPSRPVSPILAFA